MRGSLWLAGAGLALSSTLALAAPESLLPPVFEEPAPAPTPSASASGTPTPSSASTPAVQGPPRRQTAPAPSATSQDAGPRTVLPNNFPTLRELEAMSPDELDAVFGLVPKFDIPPSAQRAMREIGVIDAEEGGFPATALAGQPGALVRAAIQGTRGPMVSRWGHILVRRALASRLDAPRDMDPVAFAAMRASLLNRMGEAQVARALVQDIDSANYTPALATAAFDAYLATGDILGICPVAQLKTDLRDDPEWEMTRAICRAYSGNPREAEGTLRRALSRGLAPRIDVLLAQRYAGAAGDGRRQVTIEWDGIDELTPWRLGLSRALGVEVPDTLREAAPDRVAYADAQTPAVPVLQRIDAADRAGARGILSSSAMVDLYAQMWADAGIADDDKAPAVLLRNAYAARDLNARLSALRTLWGTPGQGDENYGGLVLTAYAAARLPVTDPLLEDSHRIVAAMLAAGLDRNALRWAELVPDGSEAWGMLALVSPASSGSVSGGDVDSFIDQDQSPEQRKSRFLVAGLAGLGRLDVSDASDYISDLGGSLGGETAWTRKITRAAELRNPALVALLAGVGMQGDGWDKMTARHLFHICRSLNQVGLNAEARMIAAEAVARG